MMQNVVLKQSLPKLKKYLLILIGSLTWSITMVKSGFGYASLGDKGAGLGFWGANGHDGIWHIALSESLSRWSLQMPIFSGENLKNYHIGFDLLLAVIHKITNIPIPTLYFQIIPVLLSLLIGLLTYKFVKDWHNSEYAAFWSTFFVYFGGSFGWVIGKGESTFWSQQSISSLINPPFALSLVFILWGLILLIKLNKKFSRTYFIICVIVFGSLIEIKAYAGLLVIGALLTSGIYSYYINRNLHILKIFLWVCIMSLILYLPLNSSASKLMVYQPFWFLESMMGLSDRVNFVKFYSAMLNYKTGHVLGKGFLAYGVAFLIFIFGNFGTRLLFIFRKVNPCIINIFVYTIIFAGLIIPMFFVQSGTPWNTIQFFYYSLFLSSILAGVLISDFLNNSKLNTTTKSIITVIIIVLTIPTTIITLKDVYIPNRPPAMIGESEISALNFLSSQPAGIILTEPFNEVKSKEAEENPPRPLYLYTSTSYVSAFSKHNTFLEDEINLDITGFNWRDRREQAVDWFKNPITEKSREFLLSNNIKYIYWLKNGQPPLDLLKLKVVNIFENNLVTIYRVD